MVVVVVVVVVVVMRGGSDNRRDRGKWSLKQEGGNFKIYFLARPE